MAWGLLASPICRLNGRVSTKCSAFLRSKRRIRTVSLLSAVSVSGKRDFAARDETAETAAQRQVSRLWRSASTWIPRQFGAICTTPGNLCLYGTAWWGWEDSNFQPNDYQLLASEVPEVARLCVQRLVSAKSRLNFNEAVSAPLSLLQKFRFLAGDHYRRGLY